MSKNILESWEPMHTFLVVLAQRAREGNQSSISHLPDVQRTRHLFRTVQAAVTPTRVLPAPHGSTMTPDLARPLPNIFLKLFSYTTAQFAPYEMSTLPTYTYLQYHHWT